MQNSMLISPSPNREIELTSAVLPLAFRFGDLPTKLTHPSLLIIFIIIRFTLRDGLFRLNGCMTIFRQRGGQITQRDLFVFSVKTAMTAVAAGDFDFLRLFLLFSSPFSLILHLQ